MVNSVPDIVDERLAVLFDECATHVTSGNLDAAHGVMRDVSAVSMLFGKRDVLVLSEYFEWLFKNLTEIYKHWKVSEEDTLKARTAIANLLVKGRSLASSPSELPSLWSEMADARLLVTSFQRKYSIEGAHVPADDLASMIERLGRIRTPDKDKETGR